jgi:hypothetical protein
MFGGAPACDTVTACHTENVIRTERTPRMILFIVFLLQPAF